MLDEFADIGKAVGIDVIDVRVTGTAGRFRHELSIGPRPARVEHLAKLDDRHDDDQPDRREEQRADRSMIGQKIAEVQHHVQRQDIADPYDLGLGVVEAHGGVRSLQRREQHLVGIVA